MKIRNIKQNRQRRAAFTLMEMMVVVAIIVALAGMGIFYMAGQAEEGNKAKARADIKNLTAACLAYQLNHQDKAWPQNLTDLLQRDDQGHGPYIQNAESLVSPWGPSRPYVLDASGTNNGGTQPDIYVTMPNGAKIANWTNRITQ